MCLCVCVEGGYYNTFKIEEFLFLECDAVWLF
jgi:hypothetical protein